MAETVELTVTETINIVRSGGSNLAMWTFKKDDARLIYDTLKTHYGQND